MRLPPHAPNIGDLQASGLQEAFRDHRYWDALRRVEERYWHWDTARFYARSEDLDPAILWALVKLGRVAQYRMLSLTGHEGKSLRYTMPSVIQRELMLVDQELAGRLGASEARPVSQSHQERFIINALREEAIASSMLEGAATTRREAKAMLKSGRKPRDRGEQMVLNNYNAISFIREHREVPLTPDFIIEVQAMLTESTLDDPGECGRLRTSDDDVAVVDNYGQLMHTPPDASELQGRLESLCVFANAPDDGGDFLHPLLRAITLHFQIGFDHPFCDGNGRTARAIFYWAMLNRGYWLFEYLPISRMIYRGPAKYARAYLYTETDEFDVTYFFIYHARIIARGRRELKEYIVQKQREVSEARRLFQADSELNHRQREVVMRFLRNPFLELSIRDHQHSHGIAYGTARSDLLQLAEIGYLRKLNTSGRFEFVRGPKLESMDAA